MLFNDEQKKKNQQISLRDIYNDHRRTFYCTFELEAAFIVHFEFLKFKNS